MKPKDIKLNVGVKSIIINNENQILLVKRNKLKYPKSRGLWDIPGGRIKAGSGLLSNLKREIYEETKIKRLKILNLINAQDIFHHDKIYYHVVRLTYISRVTSSKVTLDEENTDYMWVSREKALKLKDLDYYIREILKDKNKMSFIKSLTGISL